MPSIEKCEKKRWEAISEKARFRAWKLSMLVSVPCNRIHHPACKPEKNADFKKSINTYKLSRRAPEFPVKLGTLPFRNDENRCSSINMQESYKSQIRIELRL